MHLMDAGLSGENVRARFVGVVFFTTGISRGARIPFTGDSGVRHDVSSEVFFTGVRNAAESCASGPHSSTTEKQRCCLLIFCHFTLAYYEYL